MPLIDTLVLKTGLVDAGLDNAQVDAIVQAFVHADTEHLATKADISRDWMSAWTSCNGWMA